MIINRDIIRDDITYDGHTKQEICALINRWKRLLRYKYGLQKGNTVCVHLYPVDIYHVSLVMAIAELGLQVFLTNKPVCMQTLHATKIAMYGPVDLSIHDPDFKGDTLREEHFVMIDRYSKQVCDWREIHDITDDSELEETIEVLPEDIFVSTSTSGTSKRSRQILWSHKDTYWISKRNADYCLRLTEDSTVYNTVNMHHIGSMLTFLLPGLMAAKTHHHIWMTWENADEFVDKLIETRTDTTLVHALYFDRILHALEQKKDKLNKRVTFSVTGFALKEWHYEYCKRVPVNFNSGYGATEIGGPFILFVDDKTPYVPNNIGHAVPGYDVSVQGDDMWVASELFNGERRKLEDKVVFDGEHYLFYGRNESLPKLEPFDFRPILDETFDEWTLIYNEGDRPDLIIWDEHESIDFSNAMIPLDQLCRKICYLKKADFMGETKLNMEQVRAFVEDF